MLCNIALFITHLEFYLIMYCHAFACILVIILSSASWIETWDDHNTI